MQRRWTPCILEIEQKPPNGTITYEIDFTFWHLNHILCVPTCNINQRLNKKCGITRFFFTMGLFWPICCSGSHCAEPCANSSIWWHWFRDRVIKQQDSISYLGGPPFVAALNKYSSITSRSVWGWIQFRHWDGNMDRCDKTDHFSWSEQIWAWLTLTPQFKH